MAVPSEVATSTVTALVAAGDSVMVKSTAPASSSTVWPATLNSGVGGFTIGGFTGAHGPKSMLLCAGREGLITPCFTGPDGGFIEPLWGLHQPQ